MTPPDEVATKNNTTLERDASEPLWAAFAERRVIPGNLNDRLDIPTIVSLADDGRGRRALDLGCGLGHLAAKLEVLGYSCTAIERERNLIDGGRDLFRDYNIAWVQADVETVEFVHGSFDLIAAALCFHFVDDLDSIIKRCWQWLSNDGRLIFSVRHPIRTSMPQGEIRDDRGVEWRVGHYHSEGSRVFDWIGFQCRNQHRTVSTYVNALIRNGFRITTVEEPFIVDAADEIAAESVAVPFFLTLAASKGN